ncbi:SGNH/GDSL hydrolase family protein [Spartinivicinus ruber]|uniref:SGNH/GDSL hydrolase family protein n=1 Tax=Spartinivicinus ruber TaxID=2683272 RepID=UPI0013D0D09D|nr:SGNH/GDSL hydrolase family protein [Spartinivicinus ruber]
MLRIIVLILAILPALLLANQQERISRIIAFGDSLSDAGNKHLITLQMNQAAKGVIGVRGMPPNVSARFSNGFSWVDQLNISLWRQPSTPAMAGIDSILEINNGTEHFSFPLSIQPLKGNNWAVGGAMTGSGYFVDIDLKDGATLTSGGTIMPNIGQQINDFAAQHGRFLSSDLVILQGGANNLWFTLFGDLNDTGHRAALKLIQQISQLKGLGAKHILVMNLPSFQYGAVLNPYAEKTKVFIEEFNKTLSDKLAQLDIQQYEQPTIYLFDVHKLFTKVIDRIESTGQFKHEKTNTLIKHVLEPAWNWSNNKIADDPNEYLFWDGLHPSASTHRLLAYKAKKLLLKNGVYFRHN